MIVCYHPSMHIAYEHTKPIPQLDPVHSYEETQDQVLKPRLEENGGCLEQGLMIEQLSKCSLLLSTIDILVDSIIDVIRN